MVKIDNEEINRLENNDPRKFENVNIYAGDSFNDPANARLKNLQYDNIEDNPITIGNRQIERVKMIQKLFKNDYHGSFPELKKKS